MRQLQERQKQEVDKRPTTLEQEEVKKATPVSENDIYSPTPKESMGLATEATKAPIGAQERDVLDFLQQPEQEQLLAELTAKQQQKIETARNEANNYFDKKIETASGDEEDSFRKKGMARPANARPLPRFYVSTGRFGTITGAGSRRSLDGQLY